MSLAVVQPYFFPYVGYFQLINAVQNFVFYDDVNFVKKGWINRNRILINGSDSLITVPLIKPSQNKIINEIETKIDSYWIDSFKKKIELSYKKAPYFKDVVEIIDHVFSKQNTFISDLAINSTLEIVNYLMLDCIFSRSSVDFSESKGLDRTKRLVEITKLSMCDQYINPIGGQKLYSKSEFESQGVTLNFIQTKLTPYKQFDVDFVAGLSILDVLMFNSKEEVLVILNEFELI